MSIGISMIIKSVKLSLLIAFVLLAGFANAAVLDRVKISTIHSAYTGVDGVFFTVDGDFPSIACTTKNGFFLAGGENGHIEFKETLSILLAASMSNKDLFIGVDGTESSCISGGAYSKLLWVKVYIN